jgi:hypothetical protein
MIEVARLTESLLGHTLPGQTMKAGICGHIPDGAPRAQAMTTALHSSEEAWRRSEA